MPVALPDVTVVTVATTAHRLTQLALDDTLAEISPAETIVWTDRPIGWAFEPSALVRTIEISPGRLHSVADWSRLIWYDVPLEVKTSHFLVVQWDGWVLDGSRWLDEWMSYDYIGALWPWHKHNRVGNGGFRLTSVRLARFLATHAREYPLRAPDDDTICRVYRGALERNHGFLWPPEHFAERFSIEWGELRPHGTFGFHDCRNWARLLSPAKCAERMMAADAYVRAKKEYVEATAYLRHVTPWRV